MLDSTVCSSRSKRIGTGATPPRAAGAAEGFCGAGGNCEVFGGGGGAAEVCGGSGAAEVCGGSGGAPGGMGKVVGGSTPARVVLV
ncbi:hypothetical protein L6R29_07590 [Myxococcota bacterium]|nr:hypothetical protein [Myxococcota bacterium]